jgi:hypothetical protein
MKILKTLRFLLLLLCLTLCIESNVVAEDITAGEYEVKAAFLVNFLKFVEWPQGENSRNSAYYICVLGNSPFGPSLVTLQNKIVTGKRVITKLCKEPHDTNNCHIVIISASEKESVGSILEEIRDSNILTVSDMKGFARAGGIIQLVTEGDKVHFWVNINAASRAKLKISSQLLKLSRIFRE